jgi:hypothetical protein
MKYRKLPLVPRESHPIESILEPRDQISGLPIRPDYFAVQDDSGRFVGEHVDVAPAVRLHDGKLRR